MNDTYSLGRTIRCITVGHGLAVSELDLFFQAHGVRSRYKQSTIAIWLGY